MLIDLLVFVLYLAMVGTGNDYNKLRDHPLFSAFSQE